MLPVRITPWPADVAVNAWLWARVSWVEHVEAQALTAAWDVLRAGCAIASHFPLARRFRLI